jgi:hypothetical protein
MKLKSVGLIIAIIAIASCATRKNTVRYQFPSSMSATVKADYVKQWEKGKALYEENCAKCHNIKRGKKTIIPIFPEDKLAGYDLRQDNANHENSIAENKITSEEMVYIITFLTYKVHTSNDTVRDKNHL